MIVDDDEEEMDGLLRELLWSVSDETVDKIFAESPTEIDWKILEEVSKFYDS